MKILTMCRGGHVRSVGAKFLLSYKYGHEVLACGWESNSDETLEMLFDWADFIIVMKDEFMQYVPKKYKGKTFCYHVGRDIFGNPFHPDLQKFTEKLIKSHGKFYVERNLEGFEPPQVRSTVR